MRLIRFVVHAVDAESKRPQGVFQAALGPRDRGEPEACSRRGGSFR